MQFFELNQFYYIGHDECAYIVQCIQYNTKLILKVVYSIQNSSYLIGMIFPIYNINRWTENCRPLTDIEKVKYL